MNLFLRLLILLLFIGNIRAQDLHYSQFYNSPLVLNPANTGIMDEDYRLSAIHRDQWKGIDANYVSTAMGFDMNFKGLNEDKIGAGVLFYKDAVGNGVITNHSFLVSGAYHRTLDLQKRHHVSLGVQGGYIQKQVNSSELKFGNQYVNYVYNPAVDANEDLLQENLSYFDLHAGLVWTYKLSPYMTLRAGVTFMNVTTPKETIYGTDASDENELGMRNTFHANFSHDINEKLHWSPKILYMRHTKGTDALFGVTVGYNLTPDFEVNAGPYYRNKDAMIFALGISYQKLDITCSYDMTNSSLNEIQDANNIEGSGSRGAWEISLILKGVFKNKNPIDYTVPCGIF